jgi:hypothetical protein
MTQKNSVINITFISSSSLTCSLDRYSLDRLQLIRFLVSIRAR